MPDNHKHIKPTADLIRRYLAGELDDRTMHALEKQALDDPFLADALEGYALYEPDQSAAISDLQARLNERISSGRKTAAPVAASGPESAVEPGKGKVRRLDYRWAAAAVILVILSVGGVLLLNKDPREQDIAQVPQAKDTAVLAKPDVNTVVMADTLSGLTDIQKDSAPRAAAPSAEDQAREAQQQQALSAGPREKALALEEMKAAKKAQRARTIAPQPPPAARAAETSAYAAAPAPLVVKENVHIKNDIIDTIMIGSMKKDTGSDLAVRKALAQGNKVEGVVTGAESKYRRYSEENDLRILSGQVIDAMNGQKLPGVVIQVRGTDKAVMTDTAGYFALKVEPNKKLDLDFSYVGYEKTNVAVAGNQNHLNVSMPQTVQALNDVVVTGYGTIRKKNTPAVPYYGDSAYRKYLESKKTVPVEGLKEKISGEVYVSFTVMPDGTLKNIKAHRPFHKEAGAAAVEIIEDGPDWLPASNGKRSTVYVKVPVELVPAE